MTHKGKARQSHPSPVMEDLHGVALVLSNVLGLCTAAKLYGLGHGLIPLSYVLSVIASMLYHSCDWWDAFCVLPYHNLRDLDFFFAQTVLTSNAMLLIHWVSPDPSIAYPVGIPFLQTAFIIFFAVVNAVLVIATDDSFVIQFIVFCAAFGVVVLYALVYMCRFGQWPRYNLVSALPAVVLTATSVMLFNYQNSYPKEYWLIHSAWHQLGYGGGWYWAGVMPAYDPLLNIGATVSPIAAVAASMASAHITTVAPGLVRRVVRV